MERDMKDIVKRFDKIEKNVGDISYTLERLSLDTHVIAAVLSCNVALLIGFERFKSGLISMNELRELVEISTKTMETLTQDI